MTTNPAVGRLQAAMDLAQWSPNIDDPVKLSKQDANALLRHLGNLEQTRQALLDAAAEQAERTCRRVFKHNETSWSGGDVSEDYKSAFETACDALASIVAEDIRTL